MVVRKLKIYRSYDFLFLSNASENAPKMLIKACQLALKSQQCQEVVDICNKFDDIEKLSSLIKSNTKAMVESP